MNQTSNIKIVLKHQARPRKLTQSCQISSYNTVEFDETIQGEEYHQGEESPEEYIGRLLNQPVLKKQKVASEQAATSNKRPEGKDTLRSKIQAISKNIKPSSKPETTE